MNRLARYYKSSIFFLIFIIFGADNTYAGAAREALTAFSKDLQGLQGQFSQQVLDTQGQIKESTSGHLALAVPNRLRWEYTAPHVQLILADGRKVWIYEPDLEQVTVRDQEGEELSSPLLALLDLPLLERQYDVSEEAAAREGLYWLSLNPKQDAEANFHYAEMGFVDNQLARLRITDALGQDTVIHFSNWQKNPVFTADTFRFIPDDNTDVIGEL